MYLYIEKLDSVEKILQTKPTIAIHEKTFFLDQK